MTWETAEAFRDWWCKAGWPIRPPFRDPVFFTDNAMSLCWFREGRFQVELYINEPNSIAPFHSHPGVDSCFIYLAGNLEFGLPDGSFTDLSKAQMAQANGTHRLFGKVASVPDGVKHSVRTFGGGGAFLSFEKWNCDNPTSVTVQWSGDPVGEQHAKTLESSNAH